MQKTGFFLYDIFVVKNFSLFHFDGLTNSRTTKKIIAFPPEYG